MNQIEQQFLTSDQLAERYGLSPATIADWRRKNRGYGLSPATIKDWRAKKFGPPYYTLERYAVSWGSPRVRYDLHKLLAWEEANNITPIQSF